MPAVIDRALRVSAECDLLLAVGSTLAVYPVAELRTDRRAQRCPGRDRQRLDRPRWTALADVVVRGSISDILPALVVEP